MAPSSEARRSPRLLPRATKAMSAMAPFQIIAGAGEDITMIERQLRWAGQCEPIRLGRVVAGARLGPFGVELRQIDNADGAAARIAFRFAEGVQLHQLLDANPRLFEGLTPGRRVEIFVHVDEAARQ